MNNSLILLEYYVIDLDLGCIDGTHITEGVQIYTVCITELVCGLHQLSTHHFKATKAAFGHTLELALSLPCF